MLLFLTFEPQHDKTSKMAVRPAKTQISLGIFPVWSESSLSAWGKLGSLSTQGRLWSDWADTRADLSLRWAHTHFVGFVCHGSFVFCSGLVQPRDWKGSPYYLMYMQQTQCQTLRKLYRISSQHSNVTSCYIHHKNCKEVSIFCCNYSKIWIMWFYHIIE